MELRRSHVILAAVAAFIAWGHATYWAPSIRWIPYSFLGGVAATIIGLIWVIASRVKQPKVVDIRKYYGPSHVKFIEPGIWQKAKEDRERKLLYVQEKIYPESPAVSIQLDMVLELVLRDFVKSWYNHISAQPTFPNEVDRAIRRATISILDRLMDIDIVGVIISKVVPIITTHMHDFNEAEQVVRGQKLTRAVTESEGLDMAIAGKFRKGNLHPAVSLTFADTTIVAQQHLKGIVSRLLPQVLPPEMLTSTVVNVLTKELVACAVLSPVLRILADPDTWHQVLENYGRTVLQERKSVRKLRQALDEHAPPIPSDIVSAKGQPLPSPFPKLLPQDSERKFEKWIRSISKIKSLSDARRFRSEVAIQLQKASMEENQDPGFLKKLEHGKRVLDRRIAQLGAGSSMRNTPVRPTHKRNTPSQYATATLRDILYNASGLSYFMEFMDRQNLMRLVQFWIVVDGMRDPLEEDEDQSDHHPEHPLGNDNEKSNGVRKWTSSDRGDLAQINEGYLSKPEISKCISPAAREIVKTFLRTGKSATDAQYLAARKAVLSAQTAAYAEMLDPYFENFKRSDMWMKFLASEDAVVVPQMPPPVYEPEKSNPMASRPMRSTARNSGSHTSKHHHHQHQHQHQADLRKAVVAASDARINNRERKPLFDDEPVRASFESTNSSHGTSNASRLPLFDEDVDSDRMGGSVQSLESDGEAQGNGVELAQDSKVVDAMQEALNSIMGEDPEKDDDSQRNSMELPPRPVRTASVVSNISNSSAGRGGGGGSGPRGKATIASLGLVEEGPTRRGVFEDDLFGEEIKFPEDDKDSSSDDDDEITTTNSNAKKLAEEDIHEASPGDLGLAEAIDALTLEIEKLVTQESIVDSLTNKAELTNNAAELRILRKSKAGLQREINRKELQRQQYIVQESDSSLHGRATVAIKSVMTGTAEDGREFAMYIIEVTRKAGESMPAASWVVARRYSAFHDLHKRLKARYPQIKTLDFPRRQMPVLNLQRDFLERRRVQLERYLRALLENPAICRSRELRAFLSQQQLLPNVAGTSAEVDSKDFVTRIYNSVTDGMEEFLGNVPVLDQLSLAGQNLISAAATQLSIANAAGTATPGKDGLRGDGDVAASKEAEAELARYAAVSAAALASVEEPPPFVKPLCDIFLEAFELNRQNNWLRGRAVVFVLQQLLGGTVERKIRENLRGIIFSEQAFAKMLDWILETVWPGGKRFVPKVRTPQDKTKSRKEAGVVLAGLVPELVGSVVGRQNASGAARRILAMLNNERLMGNLVFEIFDEVVEVIFGEGIVKH